MAPALKFFVQTDGDARSHAAVASILPAGVKRLFRRRLIELSGTFVFAAGALYKGVFAAGAPSKCSALLWSHTHVSPTLSVSSVAGLVGLVWTCRQQRGSTSRTGILVVWDA